MDIRAPLIVGAWVDIWLRVSVDQQYWSLLVVFGAESSPGKGWESMPSEKDLLIGVGGSPKADPDWPLILQIHDRETGTKSEMLAKPGSAFVCEQCHNELFQRVQLYSICKIQLKIPLVGYDASEGPAPIEIPISQLWVCANCGKQYTPQDMECSLYPERAESIRGQEAKARATIDAMRGARGAAKAAKGSSPNPEPASTTEPEFLGDGLSPDQQRAALKDRLKLKGPKPATHSS